jgi:hypothetical protein
MRRVHPKSRQLIALVAAIGFVCAGGCRNQTSGLPNPFLAPDRVPPPATRALLPGQAQPYYPGDPLPVMQSSAAPGTAPGNANSTPAATQFTSADGLNWGAAGSGSGDPRTTSDPRTTVPNDPQAMNAAAIASNIPARSYPKSNEPGVVIPTDGDSLRFALPAPEPASAATVAAAPTTASSPQPMQLSAAPSTQTVVPAAYLAPIPNNQTAAMAPLTGGTAPPPTGPWRSPQIAPQSSVAPFGVPTINITQPNSMDVRLRAVPSPEPVPPTTPRIRLPGSADPSAATGASTLSQPTPFYAAPYTGSPVFQTVEISPVAPPSGSMAMNSTAQGVVASSDGFRARSSMR